MTTGEMVTLAGALLAGIVALTALPIGHWLQGRRERQRWLDDQRLEKYAALASASSQMTDHAWALIGQVKAFKKLVGGEDASDDLFQYRKESYVESLKAYRTTRSAFLEALHSAALVAGSQTAAHVADLQRSAAAMAAALSRREWEQEGGDQEISRLIAEAGRMQADFITAAKQELRTAYARTTRWGASKVRDASSSPR